MKTAKNKLKAPILVILVGLTVILRIAFSLNAAMRGFGILDTAKYISIAFNLFMYFGILKYTIDHFVKGKDISLNGLVLRFGLSVLATLMGLHNESKLAFKLTAVMVFIVPYVSASIKSRDWDKENVIVTATLIFVVWVISIILAALYIKNPVQSDVFFSIGIWMYRLDVLNPTIEWTLFSIFAIARCFEEKKQIRIKNPLAKSK